MGSGKGCRPSLGPLGEVEEGVQPRTVKGVAEKVEVWGPSQDPEHSPTCCPPCTLASRCGHKQRPFEWVH